jgi:hypothetical protein
MNKFDEIEKKNPFRVPENYFEEINRKILADNGTTKEERESKRISPFIRFRKSLLVAASISGFLLIGYTTARLIIKDNRGQQVSEILYDINSDSLINDIDISSLEEDASEISVSDEGSGVSKNEIIDYLIQDNIDINDIYEKL